MAINKVEFGGQTLVDLTADTVTPETLAEGTTAHDKAGNPIVGMAKTGGAVESVNGKTGAVRLTAQDIPNIPVVTLVGDTLRFDNVIDVAEALKQMDAVIGGA